MLIYKYLNVSSTERDNTRTVRQEKAWQSRDVESRDVELLDSKLCDSNEQEEI